MTVLADTSVWVRYLREGAAGTSAPLDSLLADGEVVMCGPVAAELMAGADPQDGAELWAALRGLRWTPIHRDAWRRIGEAAGALRRSGAPVPLTDVVIAVAALEAGAAVWTLDRDFERLPSVLAGLELVRPDQPGTSR